MRQATFAVIVLCSQALTAEGHGPLSPQEARTEFHLAPGLKMELVAAEPDVQSPVAMAFDEDGRLWVVEMLDYPNGPAKGTPPEGRIRILEDRDGSGRYKATRVFADKLQQAGPALMSKRGGCAVIKPPEKLGRLIGVY